VDFISEARGRLHDIRRILIRVSFRCCESIRYGFRCNESVPAGFKRTWSRTAAVLARKGLL